MPGTLSEADLIEDLRRSLNDSANVFNTAGEGDWRRVLNVALVAMQAKRPRTLLGQVTLAPEQVRYPVAETDFAQYKSHLWGTRQLNPWEPAFPGALPRVSAGYDGQAWALHFDAPPSDKHLAAYGRTFKFWYFGTHSLATDAANSTIAPGDRPLLLLRAQAELMRELSMRGVNKSVSLRDGYSGTPRNSTSAAMFQALLQEFNEAR
jgi:hypothetical protein